MSKAQYLGPIAQGGAVALDASYRWQCTEGHEAVEWHGSSLESVCWYCETDLRDDDAPVVYRSRFSKNFYTVSEMAVVDANYRKVTLENATDRH